MIEHIPTLMLIAMGCGLVLIAVGVVWGLLK